MEIDHVDMESDHVDMEFDHVDNLKQMLYKVYVIYEKNSVDNYLSDS